MLQLTIPEVETFDEATGEFHQCPETVLKLEHSLVSISKWESRWHIPFMDDRYEKTLEQTIDYIKCMTLNTVNQEVYFGISNNHINKINAYIENPMSATTFSNSKSEQSAGSKKQIVTSELIYSWMVAFNIPSEYQKWHINRLINLIHICEIQNKPPKKKSKRDIISKNAALNAARRKQLNSKG